MVFAFAKVIAFAQNVVPEKKKCKKINNKTTKGADEMKNYQLQLEKKKKS